MVSLSGLSPGRAQWFALHLKPRHEKAVAEALRSKGYEEHLPLYRVRRRWSDRSKDLWLPMFSQYTFCRFDPAARLPILRIPGVRKIVGFQDGPAAIEDDEVQALQAITRSGLRASPCEYLAAGQRVRLIDGPLSGLEGIFESLRDAGRLIVSIRLLQRSVAVEVEPDWIVGLPARSGGGPGGGAP